MHLGDGPELSKELEARLGRRYDIELQLRDFDVIFSVKVDEPDHINLEEMKALLLFVKWILRSASRFAHRIVVLIDSKVVVGAVTKGRSSSFPLNRLIKRLAATCFAGGIVLHCVFIPTSHNPSDWPSRGGPDTWPRALRKRSIARRAIPLCPGCGVAFKNHPLHLRRRMRGKPGSIFNCCNGERGSYAYDTVAGIWVNYADWCVRRLETSPSTSARLRKMLSRLD